MRKHTVSSQIASLFKPWFVKRPNGGCQVLFPLSELDSIVDQILSIVKAEYSLCECHLPFPPLGECPICHAHRRF